MTAIPHITTDAALGQWLVLPYPEKSIDGMTWDGFERALDVLASLPGENGLSLRVGLGNRVVPSATHEKAWVLARSKGLKVECEAWVGRFNSKDEADVDFGLGEEQGAQLGEVVYQCGLDGGRANNESAGHRGPKVTWRKRVVAPGADDFKGGLASGFRLVTPARLMELGYRHRGQFYVEPSAVGLVAASGLVREDALYDCHGAMVYQNSEKKVRGKLGQAFENVSTVLRAPQRARLHAYVSVGRLSKLGRSVGLEETTLALAANRPPGVVAIAYYAGMGPNWGLAKAGWRQVLTGHRKHRALIDLWPEVARVSSGGGLV